MFSVTLPGLLPIQDAINILYLAGKIENPRNYLQYDIEKHVIYLILVSYFATRYYLQHRCRRLLILYLRMSATPANTTLPSLASLSRELIHYIISLANCSSALKLRLVCRAFHSICGSRILFRELIDNGNGLSDLHPSNPRWTYSELVLSLQQPVNVWARYALADQKVRELSIFPRRDLSPTGLEIDVRPEQILPTRFESWIPQLCALHRRYYFFKYP